VSPSEQADQGALRRRWRWYRSPGSDRVVAKEEMERLAEHGRAALTDAIRRFRRGEELPAEVKKLTDCRGLWEIRVSVLGDRFRAIFFYDHKTCVCVTAVQKNQQLLPPVDKKRAMNRMAAWQREGRRRE
jgi:phage-related protein